MWRKIQPVQRPTTVVAVRRRSYYYYGGTYYTYYETEKEYEVVAPPEGALVTELPADAEEVEIDGVAYYKDGDTYYQPVHVEGILQYRVVEL